jgi:hypothetical protein
LAALLPKEITIVGIDPLPVPQPGKRTIDVSRPFMTVDDVKLVVDSQKAVSNRYVVVLYVSEIRFVDGTQWVMQSAVKNP